MNRVTLRTVVMGGCLVLFASAPAIPDHVFAASDPNVWGEDPFGAPPGAANDPGNANREPVAPAELQGVIAGPSGMVAIIDDRIVRIGDRLGAELVEEITPRAVVLRRGTQVRRLAISVLPTHGR